MKAPSASLGDVARTSDHIRFDGFSFRPHCFIGRTNSSHLWYLLQNRSCFAYGLTVQPQCMPYICFGERIVDSHHEHTFRERSILCYPHIDVCYKSNDHQFDAGNFCNEHYTEVRLNPRTVVSSICLLREWRSSRDRGLLAATRMMYMQQDSLFLVIHRTVMPAPYRPDCVCHLLLFSNSERRTTQIKKYIYRVIYVKNIASLPRLQTVSAANR
jgi:hypothetical protein